MHGKSSTRCQIQLAALCRRGRILIFECKIPDQTVRTSASKQGGGEAGRGESEAHFLFGGPNKKSTVPGGTRARPDASRPPARPPQKISPSPRLPVCSILEAVR